MAKKGFPVWEKMTMFGADGAESFSTVNEVVEFSQATLDASLFDIPAGYREVKDFASAFSTPTTNNTTTEPQSTETQPTTTPATTPTTTAAPEPAKEPKKEENPVKKGLKSLKPKW